MMRILALIGALLFAGAAVAQPVAPNQMFGCQKAAQYDASTNGATALVTASGTQQIYICGFDINAAGTVNVSFVYGATGTSCATSQNPITPAFQLTAQVGIVDHLAVYTGLTPAPSNNDVCIKTSSGVAVQAILYYTQF